MVKITGIRFKRAGKIYFFDPGDQELKVGQKAIVETVRGIEMGDIVISGKMVREEDVVQPLKKIMRAATEEDLRHSQENAAKEPKALEICHEKVKAHSLPMKLVGAEYTFDNSKIIFYFTAEGRVDFRELVKDLASVFKTRIELRQIGVRDEAKLVGGLGPCGLPMCCTTWLGDFDPVSIKMAKEQNLSLNPAKISGICGRLMCCLKYESGMYDNDARQARRNAPPQRPAEAICEPEPASVEGEVCIGCERIMTGPAVALEDEEGVLVAETDGATEGDAISQVQASAPSAPEITPSRPAAEGPAWKREKPHGHRSDGATREPRSASQNDRKPHPIPARRGQDQPKASPEGQERMQAPGRRPEGRPDRATLKSPGAEKAPRQGWQEFQPREKQAAVQQPNEARPASAPQDSGDRGPNFKSRRRRHGHRRPDGRPDGGNPPEAK